MRQYLVDLSRVLAAIEKVFLLDQNTRIGNRMLYLEDYLELIEQLPQDLRDRFTDMRELDLKVQNASDMLDTKVQKLFSNGAKLPPEVRDEEYKTIKENYGKVLEDADEKVNTASQLYDLVERYLRKLNQELAKFKMELEADCAGVTEELERRSMLNDDSSMDLSMYSMSNTINHTPLDGHRRRLSSGQRSSVLSNGIPSAREIKPFTPKGPNLSNPVTPLARSISPSPSPAASAIPFSIGQVGAGSVALAAAAAQAVNNTLQQQHGRIRGVQASLKATYATAMKAGQLVCDDLLGKAASHLPKANPYVDVMNSSGFPGNVVSSTRQQLSPLAAPGAPKQVTPLAASSPNPSKIGRKRHHKGNTPMASAFPHTSALLQGDSNPSEPALDWVPDPNEPLYCLCNQVSYGEMVGCDNDHCPIEWFHYGCVGLTDAPKGKWYCPKCRPEIKKRKQR